VIFGAGLDVITGEPNVGSDHPLVKAKNCGSCFSTRSSILAELPGVVIPHMGSADIDTRRKMAEMCKWSPALPLDITDSVGVRNAINGASGTPLLAEVKI
jgi:glyoxylate/hydroxypyruvate reductase